MSRIRSRGRVRALALTAGLGLGLPLATVAAPTVPAHAGPLRCPISTPLCPGFVAGSTGFISIYQLPTLGQTAPAHQLGGIFANPLDWTCSGTTLAGGAYQVSCTNNNSIYPCGWLWVHANSITSSGVRTTLDCDGTAPIDGQTATVGGLGGYDAQPAWGLASPANPIVCTVDNGSGGAPNGDFVGGCGV